MHGSFPDDASATFVPAVPATRLHPESESTARPADVAAKSEPGAGASRCTWWDGSPGSVVPACQDSGEEGFGFDTGVEAIPDRVATQYLPPKRAKSVTLPSIAAGPDPNRP